MKVIHKFTIHVGVNKFEFPEGYKVLCVQTQDNKAQMWVVFNPDVSYKVTRYYKAFPTGYPFEDGIFSFVGTFQIDGGQLVYHLFELNPATINKEEIVS